MVAYDFSLYFSKNLSLFLFCREAKWNFLMLRCDDFRSIIKKKSEKHMISADATEVNFWAPWEAFLKNQKNKCFQKSLRSYSCSEPFRFLSSISPQDEFWTFWPFLRGDVVHWVYKGMKFAYFLWSFVFFSGVDRMIALNDLRTKKIEILDRARFGGLRAKCEPRS